MVLVSGMMHGLRINIQESNIDKSMLYAQELDSAGTAERVQLVWGGGGHSGGGGGRGRSITKFQTKSSYFNVNERLVTQRKVGGPALYLIW